MDAATILIVTIVALGLVGAVVLPMRKAWNADLGDEPQDVSDDWPGDEEE